jgi:heptaprenyl diphosphate synthase
MWIVIVVSRRLLGPVSLSIIGALTHNVTQLLLAYVLFVKQIKAIMLISPVILTAGIITGVFNGIVTNLIIKKIEEKRKKIDQVMGNR